ncbi:MAG: hypothetical protein QOD99_933, partial [Chthoniobacter sp.]|nr:hypothetical protein [Chthoniobacter sp.]
MFSRRLFICLTLILTAAAAQAQIQVSLKLTRRLYMAYEPVIATVSITNLTGHDVMFDEIDGQKW